MRIGDVAARLHTTTHAVRFYEREGLVPQPARSESGYREYTEDDLDRLRCLIGFRDLDLALPDAAELASLCVDNRCDLMSDQLQRLVREKRAEVRRRIDELVHLDARLAAIEAGAGDGAVLITIARADDQKGGAR
jgi:DNA-binding transcriptional MerR regulator